MNLSSHSWIPHIKEASWVAVGQVAAAAGGLLAIKVCTNLLDPAEFGQFSAALAIAGLGQVCVFGPVAQSATRFLSYAEENQLLRNYRRSVAQLFLLGAIAIVAAGVVSRFVGVDQLLQTSIVLVAAYTLIAGLQSIQLATFNAARQRRWVAGLQIADALLRPALLVTVALVTMRSASTMMVAYILTSLAIVLIATARWIDHPAPSKQGPSFAGVPDALFTKMSSFAWPFAAFGLLGSVGSHGERLLLINFASWQDVGIYSLLTQLAMAPNLMLTSVINQYYLPLVYQSDLRTPGRLGRGYRTYLLFSLVGICLVTAAIALLGRWIIPLLSTSAFLEHQRLLWVLTLSAGIFNLGQQLVLPGMRANRLTIYLPSKLLHSVALLSSALLFAPSWGVNGMALASLVAASAYTLSVTGANLYLEKSGK